MIYFIRLSVKLAYINKGGIQVITQSMTRTDSGTPAVVRCDGEFDSQHNPGFLYGDDHVCLSGVWFRKAFLNTTCLCVDAFCYFSLYKK